MVSFQTIMIRSPRKSVKTKAAARSEPRTTTVSVMQSVERTCNVLLSFKATEPVLGVSEIARRLDLPKSAVHRTLDSLVRMGLVARDRTSSRYRLGPKAADVGLAAIGSLDVSRLALPTLTELSRTTNETATLSLLTGHERFYAAQVVGPQDVRMSVEIGKRCPLYAGASGRAMLARFSPSQLDAYLAEIRLVPLTGKTITSKSRLAQQLEADRRTGFSVSLGERDAWAAAVAAPLLMGDVLVGSVSICGPRNRFTPDKVNLFGALVRREVLRLSRQLG